MDALDLLFRRLVLAARASGALERQVTVGEVLDQFVPYAAARRDGAFDSHDDYVHGLMRLVSGERSRLYSDDLMQDDLKAELDSPNPDLTVLRTYAQTKLRIATEGIAEVLAGDTDIDLRPPTPLTPGPRVSVGTPAAPTARASAAMASDAPVAREGHPTTPRGEPVTEARPSAALGAAYSAYEADRRAAEAAGADAPLAPVEPRDLGCPYCAQALPVGRTIKFCPSCGQDLLLRRCPGCSAELESGWKFCVTCGRKA